MKIQFHVNDEAVDVELEARTLLVDALRDQAGIKSIHSACSQGECGACTVLVDGRGTRSCITLAVQARGSRITTVEGLRNNGSSHPMQIAFADRGASQCGYCTPAMILTALELVERHRGHDLSIEQIEVAMAGNLCRCTGYAAIVDAVRSAS
jgi:aerobic-type carbon monoxide dehydrogenase small subunit (CoxS/CutS family)